MDKLMTRIALLSIEAEDCILQRDYNSLSEIKAEIRGIRFALECMNVDIYELKELING